MDFLLFPGGIIGVVVCLFLYLRKQETAQRALQIAKTSLTPVSEIESGYAAVAASMKALRKAKQEEHQLLLSNWQNSYIELLPDTDPEKTTHQAKLQGIKIETASFVLDKDGMRAKHNQIPLAEDGPEWKPLGYSRNPRDPDEDMSYNERRIQRAGAFVRSAPNTNAPTFGVADGNSIMRFDGYVHGEPVNGNTVWFVYKGAGSGLMKYVHSIATTDRTTSGMPNLTDPGNLDPDQRRQLGRTPAIVKNYQQDKNRKNRKKYTVEPAQEIPASTVRVTY